MIRYQKKRKRKNTLREKNIQKGQKLQKTIYKTVYYNHPQGFGWRKVKSTYRFKYLNETGDREVCVRSGQLYNG